MHIVLKMQMTTLTKKASSYFSTNLNLIGTNVLEIIDRNLLHSVRFLSEFSLIPNLLLILLRILLRVLGMLWQCCGLSNDKRHQAQCHALIESHPAIDIDSN